MFVRNFPRQAVFYTLAFALFLASCGGGAAQEPTVDPNAISTAAAETVMAQLSLQFTQTALAAPTISPTAAITETPVSLPTFALPTAGVASPTTGSGALPTVSFNTTPLTGVTHVGSTVVAPPAAATAPAAAERGRVGDGRGPDLGCGRLRRGLPGLVPRGDGRRATDLHREDDAGSR